MRNTLKIVAVVITTYLVFLPHIYAEAPQRTFKEFTVEEKAQYFANEYGADYNEMAKVITCESNWRPEVYGDGGKAYSYAQFHEPTFNMWRDELNKDLSYSNPDDHLELMAYAFSKGTSYKKHWTCWTKLYR